MKRRRSPGIIREPDGQLRRYQVCEQCWKLRNGGPGIIPHVLGAAQKDPYITPCALCGRDTQSAHFMPLIDREVHAHVPIRFVDGPRAGEASEGNMKTRVHRTYDGDGKPIDYRCDLVGAELLATVIPESVTPVSRFRL